MDSGIVLIFLPSNLFFSLMVSLKCYYYVLFIHNNGSHYEHFHNVANVFWSYLPRYALLSHSTPAFFPLSYFICDLMSVIRVVDRNIGEVCLQERGYVTEKKIFPSSVNITYI